MREEEELKQRLLRRYVMAGTFIVLSALLGYLVFLVVRPMPNTSCHNQTSSKCVSQNSKTHTATPKSGSGSQVVKGALGSKPTPPPSATSSTAPTSPVTPSNSSTSPSLTNTGPGDTFALFAGASLISGLGHYFFRKRRFSSN